MLNSIPKTYRRYYLIGLVLMLITALFSVGYHSFDEHFQILEFCSYKMGLSPSSELPWEFQAQIRPAIQPFIAYCYGQLLNIIGIYNPFILALTLRLSMGLLSWYVLCRLSAQLLPEFKSDNGRDLYVLSSLFLWFVPYLGVRFSAESFSGALFFLALAILIELKNTSIRKDIVKLLLAGVFLGFALFARIQLIGACLGIAIWLLLEKWPAKQWLYLIIGACVAFALCIVCDYWLYGRWLITPYRYFDVNILQHKAAGFGVSAWWYYLVLFILGAVPPISIILLIAFIAGLVKKPFHLLSLVCTPFLIESFAIGHKEIRFLFPISYALIFISSIGIDGYLPDYKRKLRLHFLFQLVILVNCSVLLFRIFSPAEVKVSYYKYIYNIYSSEPNTILIAYKEPPYGNNPTNNFYKPRNLKLQVVQDATELNKIKSENPGVNILFINPTLTPPAEFSTIPMQEKFSLLPDWVLKYNLNHWQDRTDLWSIYQLK